MSGASPIGTVTSPITIVGIDPGTTNVGFGVVRKQGDQCVPIDHGMLIDRSSLPRLQKLELLFDCMTDLIARHKPDVVVTERLIFSVNKVSAIEVSQAIGVLLLAIARAGVEWQEYTPAQVKMALVGYGNADKQQVQFMTRSLLGLRETPKPEHAADALAVCICHANSVRLTSLGAKL